MGRLQRKLGLSIDCLRAVELVTADGRRVRASATRRRTCSGACAAPARTSGSSPPSSSPSSRSAPTISRGLLMYPADRARDVFAALRDFAPGCAGRRVRVADRRAGRGVGRGARGHGRRADRRREHGLRRPGGRTPTRTLAPLLALGPPLTGGPPTGFLPRLATRERRGFAGLGPSHLHEERIRARPPRRPRRRVSSTMWRTRPRGEDVFSIWALGGALARVPEDATAFAGPGRALLDRGRDHVARPGRRRRPPRVGSRGHRAGRAVSVTGGHVNDVSEADDDAPSGAPTATRTRAPGRAQAHLGPGQRVPPEPEHPPLSPPSR